MTHSLEEIRNKVSQIRKIAERMINENDISAPAENKLCLNIGEAEFLLRCVNQSKAGSTKSKAKSEAARINGLKGGRPRKKIING